jgi:hypothetical protein
MKLVEGGWYYSHISIPCHIPAEKLCSNVDSQTNLGVFTFLIKGLSNAVVSWWLWHKLYIFRKPGIFFLKFQGNFFPKENEESFEIFWNILLYKKNLQN